MTDTLRVLLVEDVDDTSTLIGLALERHGYRPNIVRIATAAQMQSALDAQWDLALSEHVLTAFSAADALNVLLDRAPLVPFIIVSGAIGEDAAVALMRKGATDYVRKQHLTLRLGPAVERALAEAEDRRARKAGEVQLRRDAQLFASVRDAVIVADAAGVISYWNGGAEAIFDVTAAAAIGTTLSNRFPSVLADTLPAFLARLDSGETWHGEHEDKRPDGTSTWLDARISALPPTQDGALAMLIVARDVTPRHEAEDRVRLLGRAIDAATQGVLLTDPSRPDNPIVFVNPGFEHMTGYTAAEVLGRNCRLLQGPDSDADAVSLLRIAINDRRPCSIELLNYRKDGTPFWNELSVTPMYDHTQTVTHFAGVMTDITGRRALQDQYRHAQKMEALGQLAGGVAHDFNNLLTVISGYSDLLLRTLSPEDPNWELAEQISRAGEQSAHLTRQLLLFSRKDVVQAATLDINDVVRHVETMLQRAVGEQVELVSRPDAEQLLVTADPGHLEQVLLNLALNARDAMPTGGVLTIATTHRETVTASGGTQAWVELSVTDSGIGMTAAVRERIFEPFFTTKADNGTGLGLAVVNGIVMQSRGRISVESAPGDGTRFTVLLPRAGEGDITQPTLDLGDAPRGTESILIVDDDVAVRTLVCHLLRSLGYSVRHASSAADALRLASELRSLDLVVSDVVMRGTGGRDLAARLETLHPEVAVILMSGHEDETAPLHKPFSLQLLAREVRDVLDRRRASVA